VPVVLKLCLTVLICFINLLWTTCLTIILCASFIQVTDCSIRVSRSFRRRLQPPCPSGLLHLDDYDYWNDWNIQYSSTALLLLVNPCILHRNNCTVRPGHLHIFRLKEDASLPAMFNLLFSSTNQQLFKRTFVIKVATTDDFRNKWKLSGAIDTFRGEQRWDTKEGRGKSMKNTLHVQWYGKRHLSGWSNIKQWKNQAHSLSHCWVTRVWRHQLVS